MPEIPAPMMIASYDMASSIAKLADPAGFPYSQQQP